MKVTRRQFVKGGVSAFTMGFAAPSVLNDLALAQGTSGRHLVVLYLSGGNDALSMVVPYTDADYYTRRPTQAIPANKVLQVGSDASGKALGLHPNLSGLKSMFDQGNVAIIQRTGYPNASRSHFRGRDIWSTANPNSPSSAGWLGSYLSTLSSPIDPLVAWNTQKQLPNAFRSASVGVPSIPKPKNYAFGSPNSGVEATYAMAASQAISSHVPISNPHLSFVNATTQDALATLDRVGLVARYAPSTQYPSDGFGQALQAVAGAMVEQLQTQVFWVQLGGFDTHARQDTMNLTTGRYAKLMTSLNGGLLAFYRDLRNQGLLDNVLILEHSEFGRRVSENGSNGTDHGSAGLMMAIGGRVSGGLYGTAPVCADTPDNPTLDNLNKSAKQGVKYQTDFRSVYARIIDDWLGSNSVSILGSNFRSGAVDFI